MKNIAAVILAAGKGTRIQANTTNKVALKLAGQPIVSYIVSLFRSLRITDIVVVIGFAADSVRSALGDSVKYAVQTEQLGTADAFKTGLAKINPSTKRVISVYGDDSAFYTPQVVQALLAIQADVAFVTVKLDNPTGLGRVIRDSQGQVTAIIEEKNATPAQKKINEINTGLYCFDRHFIEQYLDEIKLNPLSKEYYLTDIIKVAIKNKHPVKALLWPDNSIWFGVNTKAELNQARQLKS